MNEQLLSQLRFEEALRLKAYPDHLGVKTIGYGHNLESQPYLDGRKIPDEITKEFAEKLLINDVSRTQECLHAAWHGICLLQGARHDACVQMVFQMGVDGFMGFVEMRKALLKCDWQKAFEEALNSKWYKQTRSRARRVALQFITGEYYDV